MGHRQAVEELTSEIALRIADAEVTIDEPDTDSGSWWIDIRHGGYQSAVEYRPGTGFGVAAPNGGYGEGPDVILPNASRAADQVVAFLVTARLKNRNPEGDIAAAVTHSIQRTLDERFEALRTELTSSIAEVSEDVRHLESELHQLVGVAGEKSTPT